MFLDVLRRRNPRFLEAAITLHQSGRIPANSYVLDLDAIEQNARTLAQEADRLGLKVLAMTKQLGRAPGALDAMRRGGIDTFVAVDMADARAIIGAGHRLGHLGHLVQVSRAEADAAARMEPGYWTVFSLDKAQEAAEAAARHGRTQQLLARIHAPGDVFYTGHEGGFDATDIVRVAGELAALPSGEFAGIVTFPALLFDQATQDVRLTPNVRTLQDVATRLQRAGLRDIEVNAPGTTSTVTLRALADAGATQVEPGHGLTGTTPLHAVHDLPETPAVLYLSEVAHLHAGSAYCFGGGLYIDPVFPEYDVQAIVARSPEDALSNTVSATLPPPEAIDYYGMLEPPSGREVRPGDTVVFGFRCQAFVTRAYVVGVRGASDGRAEVDGVWTAQGSVAQWPPAAPSGVRDATPVSSRAEGSR